MSISHQGKWADAYQSPARPFTLVHQGGPADGTTLTVMASRPPQARFYAPAQARRRRTVRLARYTLHRALDIDVILYLHSGTSEVRGPVAGHKESPAWSW